MLRRPLAALAALGLILTPIAASATRVSPMIADLSPAGRGAVGRVQMINDSPGDIPFEVLMMRGEISTDGKLEMVPADEDFLVFPTQVLLKRYSRQVFRVQYIGEPELAKSEIYYMAIKQIPVALEDATQSQVRVVVNYNVLVNIVPNGAKAEPEILSVKPVTRTTVKEPDPLAAEEDAQFAAERAQKEQLAQQQSARQNAAQGESTAEAASDAEQQAGAEAAAEPNAQEANDGQKASDSLVSMLEERNSEILKEQSKRGKTAEGRVEQQTAPAVGETSAPGAAQPAADANASPAPQASDAPQASNAPQTITTKGLEVLVGNTGNRYFLAGLSNWKISGKTTAGDNFEAEYGPKQIARFTGAGVVAPGKERLFFLPMKAELDPPSIRVEIEIPKEED